MFMCVYVPHTFGCHIISPVSVFKESVDNAGDKIFHLSNLFLFKYGADVGDGEISHV